MLWWWGGRERRRRIVGERGGGGVALWGRGVGCWFFFLDGGVCVMNAFAIEGVGFVVDEVEVEVAMNWKT